MGTDITVHTELQTHDGTWHHWGCPFVRRDYGLFAKMAGERNEDEREKHPLQPARMPALPADCTEIVRISHAAHGLTTAPEVCVLDRNQVAELERWADGMWVVSGVHPHGFNGVFDYVMSNGWGSIPNEHFRDARFIFWFW